MDRFLNRAEALPRNDLPNETYQFATANKGWEGQWGNWDDLGGNDPGWGDVKG